MPWAAAGGASRLVASKKTSHASLTALAPLAPGVRGRAGCEGPVMPPTPRLAAFLLQREDEQRASGRKVGHLRPERRVETEDERPEAAGDGNILLAVDRVANRPAKMPGAGPVLPQLFTTVSIVRATDAVEYPLHDKHDCGLDNAPDRGESTSNSYL